MHLSRPYMIVLGVVAALAAMWMLFLRPHPSGSSPVHVTHATLPGVNGLARDVAKARGAVQLSQDNASQPAAKSAAASNPTASGTSAATGGTAAAPSSSKSAPGAKAPAPARSTHAASGDRSAEVTGPLAQGKVVVILFWDSRGADDQAVLQQLNDVSRRNGKVVVLKATPSEVASFGSVTRGVQILETPTTVVIDRNAQATLLTGLTDATAIEQAIIDAARGAGSVQTTSLTSFNSGSSRSQFVARANSACHTQIKAFKGVGSLKAQITSFQRMVGVALGEVAQFRSTSQPPQDRVTLGRWYGALDRSNAEIGSAASAVDAKRYSAARGSLFAAQADFDRGSQGLADYGLTSCFSLQSRTS